MPTLTRVACDSAWIVIRICALSQDTLTTMSRPMYVCNGQHLIENVFVRSILSGIFYQKN